MKTEGGEAPKRFSLLTFLPRLPSTRLIIGHTTSPQRPSLLPHLEQLALFPDLSFANEAYAAEFEALNAPEVPETEA